jgi:hypothetical protein
VGGAWEPVQVGAGFGHDHLGGAPGYPSNGLQQRQRPRQRGDDPVNLARQPRDGLVSGVDAGQHLGGQQAVVGVEVAPQRGPQLGERDAQATLGQLGHGGGVAAAPDEGGEHRPARYPRMSVATDDSLLPASSSTFSRRWASRVRCWMTTLR